MKNIKSIIISGLFILMILTACESVLDQDPRDRYSETVVWADINLAENYLADVYHSARSGMREMLLSSVTDESFFIHIYGSDTYVQGNISASDKGPWGTFRYEHTSWFQFNTIQKANVFIANVDRIITNYSGNDIRRDTERVRRMKGEAVFLRAYAYAQMARTYGGLPLLTEPFSVGDDYTTIVRSTFRETVQFISDQCDEAAELLGTKAEMALGKATKAAALSLKSRIWLFAASDLTADGTAQNEYVGYSSPNRTQLWQNAADAAKAVIDLGTHSLANFGADQAAVKNGYYEFFRQPTLANNEIIWGKMFLPDIGERHRFNLWNGPNGLALWGGNNPTQNFVDAYQMEDGSRFFDHFTIDEQGYYRNISDNYLDPNIYLKRDPRFYASVLYDQAPWAPAGTVDYKYQGFYDRRTKITIQNGTVTSQIHGVDTRQGPTSPHNAGYTGYLIKKMQDHQIHGRNEFSKNVWIEFRYAEILLNYAEALIGLGRTEEAANYINMIRARAGMPAFTGNITEALRYERQIELAFEDKRFYDIRRWKILEQALKPARGIDIVQTTNDGVTTTTWRQTQVQIRGPINTRMYWIPIHIDEINRAPGLVQNPGY
jgi:starch-binding outer membrane protein, SusD/RagB family